MEGTNTEDPPSETHGSENRQRRHKFKVRAIKVADDRQRHVRRNSSETKGHVSDNVVLQQGERGLFEASTRYSGAIKMSEREQVAKGELPLERHPGIDP